MQTSDGQFDVGEDALEASHGLLPLFSFSKNNCLVYDSGIHRPKIVHCLDSAGGRYRQLVKGADDIRQDAVMEQASVLVMRGAAVFRRHPPGCARPAVTKDGKSKSIRIRFGLVLEGEEGLS